MAEPQPQAKLLNVPNQLTIARIVLSIVVFSLLGMELYLAGMAVFIIAAGTDWIDGWWARKYGQVTQLGRILDPFADKIIICGTFIFLSAAAGSGVAAWMTTVIVGRELLVTALRSFLEQQGADFSASMAGKLKMVFQCAAVILSLLTLHQGGALEVAQTSPGLYWSLVVSVWVAVASTIYSGVGYIVKAAGLIAR